MFQMKFYMHCEEPELTIVIHWDSTDHMLQEAVCIFSDALDKKYPMRGFPNAHFVVKNTKGKLVEDISTIKAAVKHMGDLYVTVSANENGANDVGKISQSVKDLSLDCMAQPLVEGNTNESIEDQAQMQEAKHNAAVIHLANGRVRKAIALYKEMRKENQNNKLALKGLVTCYKRAGRHRVELKYAKQGLSLFKDDIEIVMLAGEAYVNCGDSDSALETLMTCVKLGRNSGGISQHAKLDLQLLLAKAYLLKGQKDMAITVLQGVLRENLEHEEALMEYAALLFPLGPKQSEEAVSVILTVLARKQGDTRAKQIFASIMSDPKGMNVLKEVAVGVMTDAAALVYLGSCLRDHSVIKEALELFSMALNIDPQNSSIALIYLHTIELLDDETLSLQFAQQFLMACSQKTVGTLSMATFSKCLENVLTLTDKNVGATGFIENTAEVISPPARDYTDEERYSLAFMFTVVKVLYIKGLVSGFPTLLALLEPLYKGRELHQSNIRNEAAYFNCINELLKSYPTLPMTKPSPGETTLYYIGDSHCLPVAWQKTKIQVVAWISHRSLINILILFNTRCGLRQTKVLLISNLNLHSSL